MEENNFYTDALKKIRKTQPTLIDNIEKKVEEEHVERLTKSLTENYTLNWERSAQHEKSRSVCMTPFLLVNNKTIVTNNKLIELDPFYPLKKEKKILPNFDLLLGSSLESDQITLIFIEIKTGPLDTKMINQLIDKIETFESTFLENYIKNKFPNKIIKRIEYVLATVPQPLDTIRKSVKNASTMHSKKIPLIIWEIVPGLINHIEFKIIFQRVDTDEDNPYLIRQKHTDKILNTFLSGNSFSLLKIFHYSPTIDTLYQLVQLTTQLLTRDLRDFVRNNIIEIIKENMDPYLKLDLINEIIEKITNYGQENGIFKMNSTTSGENEYHITLQSKRDPRKIKEEIISKVCAMKKNEEISKPEFKESVAKTTIERWKIDPNRKQQFIEKYFRP